MIPETVYIVRSVFGPNQAPSITEIVKLIAKFEQSRQVIYVKVKVC